MIDYHNSFDNLSHDKLVVFLLIVHSGIGPTYKYD